MPIGLDRDEYRQSPYTHDETVGEDVVTFCLSVVEHKSKTSALTSQFTLGELHLVRPTTDASQGKVGLNSSLVSSTA